MKKVLFVLDSLNLGGIETFSVNVLRAINKEKYHIDFFISVKDECYYEKEVISYSSRVFRSRPKSKRPIRYCLDLMSVIKKEKYDVVHIHASNPMSAIPVYCAKKCGINNIIVHSHTGADGKDNTLFKMGRLYIRKNAKHLFTCSDLAGEWMYGNNEGVVVINNGIRSKAFQYSEKARESIRKELGITGTVYIHVGSFYDVKNHDYLIDLFNELLKIDSNSTLLLLGEGELKETIQEKVNTLGISDKTIFIGNSKLVGEFMSAADCFIFPSKYEGLPITVVEAQACGLVCFISDRITTQVLITDLINVFGLEEPVIEVARRIIRAVSYSDEANVDRLKYSDVVNKVFSIEHTVGVLEDYYDH